MLHVVSLCDEYGKERCHANQERWDMVSLSEMKVSKFKLFVVLSFVVILVPRIAHVTHVNKEIAISEAVAQSDWICLAEYLGPDKEISAGYRFRVVEHLLERKSAKPLAGEFVVVRPGAVANAVVQSVHRATGVRRFPLLQSMTGGLEFPGEKGEKVFLFLKEHDAKVQLLVAENAALPLSQRDLLAKMISGSMPEPSGKESGELVFLGKVESIDISPLENSRNNFIVKTRVLKVVKGSFDGSHFSFRIHSPVKSRIVVGRELEVKAKRSQEGYLVDPIQFLKQ